MLPTEDSFIDKLDRLVEDNFDSPSMSIEEICHALGTSRSQLYRSVREATGRSVSLYVRHRRMLRAKELLTGTELRISEVCDAVGISNPQNFSTYFTEEFGMSPTQFRKQAPEASRAPDLPAPDEQPTSSPENPPRHSPPWLGRLPGRSWVIFGGAFLLLLLGTGLYRQYDLRSATTPVNSLGVNSLAVVPFVNLGNSESDLACESIMDDIYTSVALLGNLNVIARSSSDQYKNTQKGTLQVAKELGVNHVLKGNFLKTGDQIQIEIDILDTKNSDKTWTKRYSAAYKDIFLLTDEIVADVARQLELITNAAGRTPTRTKSIEAYNAFLQGRQMLNTRTKADLLAGIERFDLAISLDSTFAEAHAAKAVATCLLQTSGLDEARKNFRLAEQIALDAIRLEPTNSTAYAVLGAIYHATYQWRASENAFRIALQHNPNDAQANYWYSLMLRSTGRVEEAVDYSIRAVTLDPLYPVVLSGHILNCVYAKRFELARQGIENGEVLFDDSFAYHLVRAYYSVSQTDYGRATAELKQAMALNPDDIGIVPMLMYCEAKAGNRRTAAAFLRGLKGTDPWNDYQRAVVYAGLSQADSSLHYLKKAADAGYYHRDTKVSDIFEPYRTSLIFRAVLRRYNLAD